MRRSAVALAVMLALPAGLGAQSLVNGVVRVTHVAGDPRLDGLPDEAEWLGADSITAFTQREPREGQPATERTVVRFLATDGGLWVALWAYDRTPERIRRTELRRDFDLDPDDVFCVVLDPQRDRRSGYIFCVNPNGALFDGEIRGTEDANEDWNGVWDARAHVAPWGWGAELFIPWQTLRYRQGDETWGLNVARVIRHRQEEVEWRSWRRQQGILYLEDEGQLSGLNDLPRRGLFEARPYAAGSGALATRDFDSTGSYVRTARSDAEAKVGFDGKLAVAPTLTLDVTANTDFAQVEVDRQVVNLSRFPLFFPEQRPFFLEAAGIFDFGQSERTQVFYSRRLGLGAGGVPIPIAAGARLSGRVGRERVGLLALRTGGDEDAVDVVARLKHDVLSRGYVGGIVTGQGGPGVAGTRRSAGLDVEVPTLLRGQNLTLAAFGAATWDSAGAPGRMGWRAFIDYPNDWSDDFLGISRIEEGFDPALGFVRQAGVWRYTGALRVAPRPRNRLGIRRLNFTFLEFDISTHLDGSPDNANYEIRPLGAEFQSGAEFELNLQRGEDVPADTFEIFPGTHVPSGHYGWDRVELQFSSSSARMVGVEVVASAGQYYSGHGEELEYELSLRAAPHVVASLDGGFQWVRLTTGRFATRTARLRLDYAANPRLNTTVFLQYDNESDRLTVNARIHWIPRPGSDAYLVWNSAWPTGLAGGVPWRRPLRGALVGKVVYYFKA